jgi:8-oxo-dGTP pyrophosphatase MutT (NUDIX family)
MPASINGLPVSSWQSVPQSNEVWEELVAEHGVTEPEFNAPAGKKAAGVVIHEPDGRIWVVAPSNAFGGYQATFPKGKMDKGLSAQATALVEAYEESGLQVRLVRHLVDVKRSTSYTRYYLAERVGGDPADMGWESQAVMLVPLEQLPQVLNNPNDRPVLQALKKV